MTTSKPLARYSTVNGALASGSTAELHHLMGHDLRRPAEPAAQLFGELHRPQRCVVPPLRGSDPPVAVMADVTKRFEQMKLLRKQLAGQATIS